MKKILTSILVNWKTSLSGLVVLSLTGMLISHKITIEEFAAATGALTSIGLIIAKDPQ